MDVRLAGVAKNSRDIGRSNLALRIPSRYSLSVMQISALSPPKLILSVQVRSRVNPPVQAKPLAGEPADGDSQPNLRAVAVLKVALRETGRLADHLAAISLL